MKRALHITYRTARRIVVAVVGATVVGIGVVMLVLPGPGLVVIPSGLAILGLEFAWARRWLRSLRRRGREIVAHWNGSGAAEGEVGRAGAGSGGGRGGDAADQPRAESSFEASAGRSGQRSQSSFPQSS